MPSRRSLLRALSSAGVAGVAGCTGLLGGDGAETTTPETLTPLSTAIPPCPDDDWTDVGTTLDCDADPAGSLTVSPQRASLPRADLRTSLANDTGEALDVGPGLLVPFKHVGDRWYPLSVYSVTPPRSRELPAGETLRRTVTVDNADLSAPVPRPVTDDDDDPEYLRGLGAGGYAFVTFAEPVDGGRRTAFVGRFALAGDRLPLEPSSRVRRTERDGESAHVWAGPEGERRFRVTAERMPDLEPGAARTRLIAESAFRAEPLRNTLCHVGDLVRRVVLRTDARFPPLLGDAPVTFRGDAYRYTVEER